jgi:hypothetical protein
MVTFYICDNDRKEMRIVPSNCEMDFDIGGEYNDLEITGPLDLFSFGQWVVCFNTEYGALLEEIEVSTNETSETWKGNSVRKFLEQSIIEPPKGEDYRIVSGEANEIIRNIISGRFSGIFEVPDVDSGFTIKSYQFNRYCTVLDGLSAMLESVNAKLSITIIQGDSGEPFHINIQAVPIVDYSSTLEWSEDADEEVTLTENRRGINHLICLGSGELKDRQVLHLYALPDGSISENQYYFGLDEREQTYDYSSVESIDDLKNAGIQQFKSLINSKTMKVSVQDLDLNIGDLVGGRSNKHNISCIEPITEKIVKIKGEDIEISYKTKGA